MADSRNWEARPSEIGADSVREGEVDDDHRSESCSRRRSGHRSGPFFFGCGLN